MCDFYIHTQTEREICVGRHNWDGALCLCFDSKIIINTNNPKYSTKIYLIFLFFSKRKQNNFLFFFFYTKTRLNVAHLGFFFLYFFLNFDVFCRLWTQMQYILFKYWASIDGFFLVCLYFSWKEKYDDIKNTQIDPSQFWSCFFLVYSLDLQLIFLFVCVRVKIKILCQTNIFFCLLSTCISQAVRHF